MTVVIKHFVEWVYLHIATTDYHVTLVNVSTTFLFGMFSILCSKFLWINLCIPFTFILDCSIRVYPLVSQF